MRVVEKLYGHSDLAKVTAASASPSRLTSGLDRGEQERDKRTDDRDHDQQLYKREAGGRGAACFDGWFCECHRKLSERESLLFRPMMIPNIIASSEVGSGTEIFKGEGGRGRAEASGEPRPV